MYCQPSCASQVEAPLRLPDGGSVCTRVGATPRPVAGDWPDPTGALAPIAYVGAAGGPRAPTGDVPLPDLRSALARDLRPGTIFVGRGTHALPDSLRITFAVTIRGMGSDQTTLVSPAGNDAIIVAATGSETLEVSLQGLGVRFDSAGDAGAAAVGVRVTGSNATVNLRDVEISRASEGVRAETGATVCAEGLSVRQSTRVGVTLTDGAHGYLRNVLVRDGAGVGIVARRSHLVIDTGLVADNGRDGVAFSGTVTGSMCSGTECAPSTACAGFQHEQTCAASLPLPATSPFPDGDAGLPAIPAESRCRSVSVLTNVSLLRNQVTGLRADRTTLTVGEADDYGLRNRLLAAPGPNVRVAHVVIAGTRAPAGSAGGYGVFVGPTSSVSFDPDIASEDRQGLGSAIVDNAGAGVLADGDPIGADGAFAVGEVALPAGLVRAGTLNMAGTLVASNRGPGAFVQRRAVAERVAFCTFANNLVLGLGVASGALGLAQSDRFIGTRSAPLPAGGSGGPSIRLGDGVGLSEVPARPEAWRPMINTVFEDSVFSDNDRCGISLSASEVRFQTIGAGNRGSGNYYGVCGGSAGDHVTGNTSAIRGRIDSPSSLSGTAGDYRP